MIYKFYDQNMSVLELNSTDEGYCLMSVNDHSQPETYLEFSEQQLFDIIGALMRIKNKIKEHE